MKLKKKQIQVTTFTGDILHNPDDDKLYDLLSEMSPNHFVIVDSLDDLDKKGDYYMQVYLNDDMSCLMEYREGGPKTHFQALVPAPFEFYGHDTVTKVLLDWIRNGDAWRTYLSWKPLYSSN
jgi:hypothetical protein